MCIYSRLAIVSVWAVERAFVTFARLHSCGSVKNVHALGTTLNTAAGPVSFLKEKEWFRPFIIEGHHIMNNCVVLM